MILAAGRFVSLIALANIFATPIRAQEDSVDLLLVLATDTSTSVYQEILMRQRAAYGAAITSPRVLRAIQSGFHGRIAVAYVEWAGEHKQKMLVPWTIIDGPLTAATFSQRLRQLFRPLSGATAIGAAIDYCVEVIERSPFHADRAVIDIAGDGVNNGKRDVRRARDDAVAKGIVINGLPTPQDEPTGWQTEHTHPPGGLTHYYFTNVVGGPGSFALAAVSPSAFRDALVKKFVAEIAAR